MTGDSPNNSCYLSIVVPVFNEAENLRALYQEITASLASSDEPYEIIFVDDGSQDASFHVLESLHHNDPRVIVVQFRRNFGQTAAFAAGFSYARGELIATIDADGQNDPMDIPRMIKAMSEHDSDLVIGWRKNRQEPLIRRFLSVSANRLISKSTQIYIHDRGCSLKLFKRDLIKSLHLYGQLHRFIPELACMVGARVTEIPTVDRKRRSGKSKYGSISRTPRVALDLMTVFFFLTYSTSPMRLFGSFSLVGFVFGGLFTGGLALAKLYHGLIDGWIGFHAYQIGNRPLFLIGIFLILASVQFLMMGLLGEMLVRIYYEAGNKPIYHVRQVLL